MKKQLITIALALLTAGALSTSCSSDFNIFDTTQQPSGNTITFTATLAPKGDDGGTTRAITPGTDASSKEILNVAWASGEQIALYYQTASGYAKATATVQSVDPTTGAATISATLDANTTDGGTVKFVYPAYLANETGDDINVSKLTTQYGLLTEHAYSISKRYDAATGEGKIHLNGDVILPTTATVTNTAGTGNVSLQNRVCICRFHLSVYTIGQYGTLTTIDGPMNDDLTINDGNGHTYTIKSQKNWPGGLAPAGGGDHPGFQTGDDIYVAMLPIENKSLTLSATAEIESVTKTHTLTTAAGTLVAGKFYRNVPVALQLENLEITGNIAHTLTVPDGMTVIVNGANFNLTDAPAIVLGDKSKLILKGTNTIRATYADAIQCNGNATIEFQSTTNTITAVTAAKKGIQITDGQSLNITGGGSASLSGNIGVPASASLKFNDQAASHNIYIPDATTLSASGITVGSTITIGSGETFTLSWTTLSVTSGPGIQCSGNATIILDGTNTVTTTAEDYPAIQPGGSGTTLTIQGSGSVTAWGGLYAAGIGTGRIGICGDISISGGTVTARGGQLGAGIGTGAGGTCGNIIITGGTIKATGVSGGAGIGSGDNGKFESINITDGITKVEAIRQTYSAEPIGKGTSDKGSGTVTIDGTTSWTAGTATEHLNFTVNNADPPCWKLTHK
jgi:hypothetical protein